MPSTASQIGSTQQYPLIQAAYPDVLKSSDNAQTQQRVAIVSDVADRALKSLPTVKNEDLFCLTQLVGRKTPPGSKLEDLEDKLSLIAFKLDSIQNHERAQSACKKETIEKVLKAVAGMGFVGTAGSTAAILCAIILHIVIPYFFFVTLGVSLVLFIAGIYGLTRPDFATYSYRVNELLKVESAAQKLIKAYPKALQNSRTGKIREAYKAALSTLRCNEYYRRNAIVDSETGLLTA